MALRAIGSVDWVTNTPKNESMTAFYHDMSITCNVISMSKAPICSCGLQMVERTNRSTGEKFYACAEGFDGCGETASHEDSE